MTERPYKYILIDNEPIACDDVFAWDEWIANPQNRKCFISTVGPYTVSTAFLCVDYNFWRTGPPILFETMAWITDVTNTIHSPMGHDIEVRDFLDEQEHCCTIYEAQAQHLAFCAHVQSPGDEITHLYSRLEKVHQ